MTLAVGIEGQARRPVSAAPGIRLYHRITIQDAQGHVVRRSHWRRSRSFVKQFLQIQYVLWATGGLTVTDTGNTGRSVARPNLDYYVGVESAVTESTHGLVVGTGSTGVAATNYQLATQIAHGTGSGQMEYGTTNISTPVVAGSTTSFTITRVFTNSSGASITVNEYGIYHRTGAIAWYFCIARDLGGGAVAHSRSITVEFTIAVTA